MFSGLVTERGGVVGPFPLAVPKLHMPLEACPGAWRLEGTCFVLWWCGGGWAILARTSPQRPDVDQKRWQTRKHVRGQLSACVCVHVHTCGIYLFRRMVTAESLKVFVCTHVVCLCFFLESDMLLVRLWGGGSVCVCVCVSCHTSLISLVPLGRV